MTTEELLEFIKRTLENRITCLDSHVIFGNATVALDDVLGEIDEFFFHIDEEMKHDQ